MLSFNKYQFFQSQFYLKLIKGNSVLFTKKIFIGRRKSEDAFLNMKPILQNSVFCFRSAFVNVINGDMEQTGYIDKFLLKKNSTSGFGQKC